MGNLSCWSNPLLVRNNVEQKILTKFMYRKIEKLNNRNFLTRLWQSTRWTYKLENLIFNSIDHFLIKVELWFFDSLMRTKALSEPHIHSQNGVLVLLSSTFHHLSFLFLLLCVPCTSFLYFLFSYLFCIFWFFLFRDLDLAFKSFEALKFFCLILSLQLTSFYEHYHSIDTV